MDNSDIEKGIENETEIRDLREEFEGSSEERKEEIRIRLAQLGAVVYPPGTPEYKQYTKDLRKALEGWIVD